MVAHKGENLGFNVLRGKAKAIESCWDIDDGLFDTRDIFRIIGHVLELRHNCIDSKFLSFLLLSGEGYASDFVGVR